MESPEVFINDISCAVPDLEVHETFLRYGPEFLKDDRARKVFLKLAKKGQIDRRYSVMPLEETEAGPGLIEFYLHHCPTTGERMERYRRYALPLTMKTLSPLAQKHDLSQVTHVIVTSCTGFYAPGIDTEIIRELKLSPTIERNIIGFMGCSAAFNAMKQAFHTVRSIEHAKVLMVNVELCTLHFQQSEKIEPMLGFLIFADGCSASLISAKPDGLKIDRFHSTMYAEEKDKILWRVGDGGFNMFLSAEVPRAVGNVAIPTMSALGVDDKEEISMWAIHPGGRSILDAIQHKLELSDEKMNPSREVLRQYGNMSSPSVMFVMHDHLNNSRAFGSGVGHGVWSWSECGKPAIFKSPVMRNLRHRSFEPEKMDLEGFSLEDLEKCLTDISKINRWTLQSRPTLDFIEKAYRRHRQQYGSAMILVDVGCGSGELLDQIAQFSEKKGMNLELYGVDRHPWAIQIAKKKFFASAKFLCCEFSAFQGPVDVVVSSLLAHHLDDEELMAYMREQNRRAHIGWFINDVHRHAIPYFVAMGLTRIAGLHHMVQYDAPLSVARSFRRKDWEEVVRKVSDRNFSVAIDWRFPFKYCVTAWRREPPV